MLQASDVWRGPPTADGNQSFSVASVHKEDLIIQACPILTTCSSRESGDSTRTSRKTMVTIGSICSSRDVVFFCELKRSVTRRCISLRQGPTQLARVLRLVQVVKLHLIKKGRGPGGQLVRVATMPRSLSV